MNGTQPTEKRAAWPRPGRDCSCGSGVDGAIRRIETDYDEQGNAFLFTSYDAPTGGNIVNQVKREFDGLGNLIREYQEHNGAVTGSTPFVDYIYAYTGNNQSRLEAIVYPDGRIIHYVYASGLDDTISRLSAIADDDGFGSPGQVLEAYTYMGTSTVVERLHPESGVDLTYLDGSAPGAAGDVVVGLDRFGRIVDHYWVNYGSSTVTDEFTYGYDRNSNRLYRNNLVDTTFGELYAYDNFNQLSAFARGTLSITTSSATIVGSPTRSQNWDPHPLGNAASITTDGTPESRGYNAQNQFTSVGGNSITYDANGNLTTDQNGNIYRYDAWNRLVRVEDSMTTWLAA